MTTPVCIAASPILQFFNNAGQFNAGGSILTQVGGINATTYQDAAGSIPLPNPIPLNNRGEISNAAGVTCQLFLPTGITYTFTIYDANGNQIDQATYCSGVFDGTTIAAQLSSITNSVTATLSSNIQKQTYTAYATAGTAPAYTITPSPVITSYAANERFNVTFSTINAGNDTLQINGIATPPNLVYLTSSGNYANVTAGQIPAGLNSDVILLSPTQALVVTIPPGGGISSLPVRQTVLGGAADVNGSASWLSAGTGLTVNLSATAMAVRLAFAQGYGDQITSISADAVNQFGTLPANNTAYLTADYASSITYTGSNTVVQPQYGYAFDRTRQALLQFGGAVGSTTFLDDWGNTWLAQGGAKVQTNQFKFGTGGLGGGGASNALNGSTDYVLTNSIQSLGPSGWAMRGWIYNTALPASGGVNGMFGATNGGGYGAVVGINNNAGTIRFFLMLSSTGSTADIASFSVGTTLPVINTWYFVELTYDPIAGKYLLYLNGIQEQSIASTSRICPVTQMQVGAMNNRGTQQYLSGYVDKFEFLPYCDHPAGTTYSVPIAAPTVNPAGKLTAWFDTQNMTMYEATSASGTAGVNPGFTARNRLFVGDCDTGASSVSAVRSYAYQGNWNSAQNPTTFAASTPYTFNHNLGYPPEMVTLTPMARQAQNQNWMDNAQGQPSYYGAISRNSAVVSVGGSGMSVNTSTTGSMTGSTSTTGQLALRARRNF